MKTQPKTALKTVLASLLLLVGPEAWAQQPQAAETTALVTRLGEDTLAVERWTWTGDQLEAVAAVRTPQTTLRRYTLERAPDGTMRRYEERVMDPADSSAAPLRVEVVERAGDGWTRKVTGEGAPRTDTVEAEASLLPFIDLVFWPYELVLQRGAADEPREQPLLAGNRAMPFTVQRTGPDEIMITHPFRGPSSVRVDAENRLLALDASETTRKVQVTREPALDVEAHARRWAAADTAGRGVGELSGRAETTATAGGATFALDYGVPSKRGREIFGDVVLWGERWRTGANRATHVTTDRPLVLGDSSAGTLEVPAGTYTLFTIPEPEGGTLIVSRQTGQNGNAYDPAQDLGRVPMRRVPVDAPVERFTIEVEERGPQAGALRLVWDRSAFVVPFTVE